MSFSRRVAGASIGNCARPAAMSPTMVIGAETGATSTLTNTDTRDTSPAISATIGMVAKSAAIATASARDKISGHFSGARTRCNMGVSTTIDAVAAHESAKPKLGHIAIPYNQANNTDAE